MLSACSSSPASIAGASSQASLEPPAPVERDEQAASDPAKPGLRLDDGSLVEGPSSRDPFRADHAALPPPPPDPRPRKARRIPIEQLKLVGLVTHTATPRAMLVDPSGKGWIVTQGELVGRPEPIASGNGERLASFRVDRIRERDVVLVREDASGSPAGTRVIALPQEPLLQADD
ncbi:Type IV pilus biogenesis protein PilP [Minicystis rosea]|nr:Type IV pilus biogenesis protein PilP [Minicystis rosea]